MMKQGVPFYVDRYDFKRIDFTESQPAEEFLYTPCSFSRQFWLPV